MHVYEIFRWTITLALGGLGWWIILMNFATAYGALVRRDQRSWVPLLGGFLAMVGMSACPLRPVQKLCWLPLAIDCAFFIIMLTAGFGLMLARSLRGKKDKA